MDRVNIDFRGLLLLLFFEKLKIECDYLRDLLWLIAIIGVEDEKEEESSYYAQQRYYDPETASFISEDPAKDGTNYYGYCGENPVNAVDPYGLKVNFDSLSDIYYGKYISGSKFGEKFNNTGLFEDNSIVNVNFKKKEPITNSDYYSGFGGAGFFFDGEKKFFGGITLGILSLDFEKDASKRVAEIRTLALIHELQHIIDGKSGISMNDRYNLEKNAFKAMFEFAGEKLQNNKAGIWKDTLGILLGMVGLDSLNEAFKDYNFNKSWSENNENKTFKKNFEDSINEYINSQTFKNLQLNSQDVISRIIYSNGKIEYRSGFIDKSHFLDNKGGIWGKNSDGSWRDPDTGHDRTE